MATMNNLLDIMVEETNINTTNISNSIKNISNTINKTSSIVNSFTSNVTENYTNNVNNIIMVSNAVEEANEKLTDADKKAKKTSVAFSKLSSSFKNAKNAISSISFSSIKSGTDYMDKYISANNKLARLSKDPEEAAGLKSKVFEAANSSNTSYTDMVGAVSDLGALDAFQSKDEAVSFAELMQKSLKLDGSSQSLSDVTKSMADGSISGDEFSSLVNGIPTIGAAMSKATGKSVSELQKLANQGLITAEVLKNSMFASGAEISSDFANQPKTFAEIWTQVTNKVMNALSPLIQLFSNIINSAQFQGAINVIMAGLTYISSLAGSLITFFLENGDLIKSMLLVLGAILIGVLGASIVSWFMMYLPIIAVVGAIALIIFALTKMGISFQDIFTFIGGLIGIFYAVFYNRFVELWNVVAAFINFFGNVFKNPVASIKILFFELAKNILGYIGTIAKGIEDIINKIPGIKVDITGGITNLQNILADEIENTKKDSGYKEFVKTKEYMDYSDGAMKGSQFASDTLKKIQGIFDPTEDPSKGIFNTDKVNLDNHGLGSTSNPLSTDIAGSSGVVDVNMAEEDTQYLRDLAEREFINKFNTTSLSPNVSITFGDVHETADAEKVSRRIAQILREQIAVAAEGAY